MILALHQNDFVLGCVLDESHLQNKYTAAVFPWLGGCSDRPKYSSLLDSFKFRFTILLLFVLFVLSDYSALTKTRLIH